MHLVLGVEHADDVARRALQRQVERLRLVLRLGVVDDHPDQLRVARGRLTGDTVRAGVVVADDRDDLEVRVVLLGEAVERRGP